MRKRKLLRRSALSFAGTMLAMTACTTLMTGCTNKPASTGEYIGQVTIQDPDEETGSGNNGTRQNFQDPEEENGSENDGTLQNGPNHFESSRGRMKAEFGNQIPERYVPGGSGDSDLGGSGTSDSGGSGTSDSEEKVLLAQQASNMRSFASDSSARIFPNVSGNYLYSPASLYMALQLCGSITAPDAAPDLMGLLGAENREDIYQQGNAVIRDLSVNNPGRVLNIGNSIWVDNKEIPELEKNAEQVMKRGAEPLGADIYYDNLTDPKVQAQMNSWISKHTGGLIQDMPKAPDYDTAMVLFNTLYFDKKWRNTVTDDQINPAKFYPEGETFYVMNDRIEYSMTNHPFVKTEHATASAVFYRDSSYMILIKPNSDDEFQAVMSEDVGEIISAYANRKYTEMTDTYEVQFGIPLLDYECSTGDLKAVLKDMGVTSIFQPGAFSDLDSAIYVSDVAQKCRIIVDQEGTKAAAVTEIEMAKGEPEPIPTVIDLRMDHEYAYVIMSKDDIPLFIGAVRNPQGT